MQAKDRKMEPCACCEAGDAEKYAALDDVLDRYECKESNLIQILHMAQAIFGSLPGEVQRYIAGRMDLPISKVNGVVTFYSFFSMEPKGKYVISVCLGTACYVRGGSKVLETLKELLGIDVAQTTEDQKFTLEVVRCIGACGLAPAMTINGKVYKRVNPKQLGELLGRYE